MPNSSLLLNYLCFGVRFSAARVKVILGRNLPISANDPVVRISRPLAKIVQKPRE